MADFNFEQTDADANWLVAEEAELRQRISLWFAIDQKEVPRDITIGNAFTRQLNKFSAESNIALVRNNIEQFLINNTENFTLDRVDIVNSTDHNLIIDAVITTENRQVLVRLNNGF